MKKILLILTLIPLLFSACTCTPKIEYIHESPYDFQTVTQPKAVSIRVFKSDSDLYKSYIQDFRKRIDFMNQQVLDYKNVKGVSNDNSNK